MKYYDRMKLVASEYTDGISTIRMKFKGKEFEGKARIHPEDKNISSPFIGGTIAEYRARVNALKYERKILKEEAEICRKFVNSCKNYKDWDPDSRMGKIVEKQLKIRIGKVNDLTDRINEILFFIEKYMDARIKTKKHIQEKLKEKDKQKKLI